jgi:Major intrinsic protein
MGRVRQARLAATRFCFHCLRQRRRQIVPGMAGTTDNGASGRPRSRGSSRLPGRNCPRVQGCLPAHQPIAIFTALPVRSLDQRSLQNKLGEIGRMKGARAKASEPTRCLPRRNASGLGRHCCLPPWSPRNRHHGKRLADGNVALALPCNTIATGVILAVLILIFGPLSGARFNPAVSVAFALSGTLGWSAAGVYIAAQAVLLAFGQCT